LGGANGDLASINSFQEQVFIQGMIIDHRGCC
jgi:hypothetical protein